MKRRMVLLDHIVLEARTLIDAEYTGYPASDGPDRPTNRTADRARRSFTLRRAEYCPLDHPIEGNLVCPLTTGATPTFRPRIPEEAEHHQADARNEGASFGFVRRPLRASPTSE
jgi:hypothetical protein